MRPFCGDASRLVPFHNLGKVRLFARCPFVRHRDGVLTISQQSFVDNKVEKNNGSSSTVTPLETSVHLEEFDVTEPEGDWPFRELGGRLMWLAHHARPEFSNAVKTVATVVNMFAEGEAQESSDYI